MWFLLLDNRMSPSFLMIKTNTATADPVLPVQRSFQDVDNE